MVGLNVRVPKGIGPNRKEIPNIRKVTIYVYFAFMSALFVGGFVFAGSLICNADAQEQPFFRISAGMHSATIRGLDTDAENHYLVTASEDKTVKVWELSSGHLLRTLRPPIGAGSEGQMRSAAITPDGRTVACGGITQADEKGSAIYLFDRQTGKMVRVISGLPNRAQSLRYSKDGRYLVAALLRENGIRVYETENYSLVKEDKEYGGTSNSADFDRIGRLVSVADDGYIRLYDRSLHLVRKEKLRSGKRPLSARFSPDGLKVAVGFLDSPQIEILSASNLSFLFSPDTSFLGRIEGGEGWSTVEWSFDGNFLFAGGNYIDRGWLPVIKWAQAGKGGYTKINVADNTVLRIVALRRGGFAFVSANPALGVYDAGDRRVWTHKPPTADYRFSHAGLLVSNDGATIQFNFEGNKSPAVLSLADGLLRIGAQSDSPLFAPVRKAEGLTITDWESKKQPKINGKTLSWPSGDTCRNLAIAPDGKSFLLGSEWGLTLFDREGKRIWRIPSRGTTWEVNISRDGRFALAGYDDGTIRWHRMSDGKELLAFFPHQDKKRWVVWTPGGYYMASPGGEAIIGWHINKGKDREGDFFPVSRFRERYYRPDVIEKTLATRDEDQALNAANALTGKKKQETSIRTVLPPTIGIVTPVDGTRVSTTSVVVTYTISSPSAEAITEVKVLVNGRPVSRSRDIVVEQTAAPLKRSEKVTARPTAKGDEARQVTVTIPQEDSDISIIASNRFAASEPATVRVKWAGKAQSSEQFVIMPKLYLLAIGVGKYQHLPAEKQLKYPSKDAKDFASTMEKQKGRLYRDVKTRVLTDDTATRDNIVDGLEWIQKETTSKDVAMIFLSGHGLNDSTGVYYFVPTNFDMQRVLRTGVPYADIKQTVANLAGKTLVFVDTCHSGNVMGFRSKSLVDTTAFVNELASAENGAVVFASATGKQYSYERPEWNNGAFTKALIEGLTGKADFTGKGKISINMLDLYLSERVKELTQGVQTPTTTKPQTIQDFPIAVR